MADKKILTAVWKHLCLITFSVPDDLLLPRVPAGFELDRFEDKACCSVVAFDFLETRVLGIQWPGLVNFPEVNLRFYVKGNGKRGVMFVKELVPSSIVARIARLAYNEPYEALDMNSRSEVKGEKIHIGHQITRGSVTHRLNVNAHNSPYLPHEASTEHFFKEHQWGFGINRRKQTLEYEVTHPYWEIFPQPQCSYHLDFGQLYGPEWKLLNDLEPLSVVLALGSRIEVSRPRRI